MRLVTFQDSEGARVGALVGDGEIVDLAAADASIPRNMLDLISSGTSLESLGRAVRGAPRMRVENVTLKAPLPRPPRNLFCVGKNYHAHAKEFAHFLRVARACQNFCVRGIT